MVRPLHQYPDISRDSSVSLFCKFSSKNTYKVTIGVDIDAAEHSGRNQALIDTDVFCIALGLADQPVTPSQSADYRDPSDQII